VVLSVEQANAQTITTGLTYITFGVIATATNNIAFFAYDQSTGIFTVPLTGRYIVSFNVTAATEGGSPGDYVYFYLMNSGAPIAGSVLYPHAHVSLTPSSTISNSTILDLVEGHEIGVAMQRSGLTSAQLENTWSWLNSFVCYSLF